MYVWLFVVPIFAKSFSLVEDKAAVTVLGYTFMANLTLPFSWKLFYFSAILFAFGNILVATLAPKIVKDHPDYGHFKEAGKGLRQLSEYANRFVTSNESFEVLAHDAGVDFSTSDRERESFWVVYDWANIDLEVARGLVATFYVVAFFLLSIVVVENLWWVVVVSLNET